MHACKPGAKAPTARQPYRARLAAMAWALVLSLCTLAGCSAPPAEQRLRNTIVLLESAIESRDASALEDVLADDFIGPDGMDRTGARRLAVLYFMRQEAVDVVTGPLEIRLQAGHATVRTTVALAGRDAGVLPGSASLRAFESGWRLEGDDWKMTSARWDQAP